MQGDYDIQDLSYLRMTLILQKVKFLFDPITGFSDCEFNLLAGLRRTLQ